MHTQLIWLIATERHIPKKLEIGKGYGMFLILELEWKDILKKLLK